MKKSIITGVALGAFALSAGIGMSIATTASASSYTITKTKSYDTRSFYHAKNSKANVYLWNKTHTKKLHNLKNYPNTSWVVSSSVVMRHNGKNALYFSVTASSPNKLYAKPVTGYVWHSYLSKGYNRHYSLWNNLPTAGFTSDSDYLTYINQSPSQSLTKQVLQLFPNSKLSLKLSGYVNDRSIAENGFITSASFTDYFTNALIPKTTNQAFYHYSQDNQSENTRLATIKKALETEGYTAAKRASMSDYQIGIYYQNQILKSWDNTGVGLIFAKSAN